MRLKAGILACAVIVVGSLASAAPTWAMGKTVCSSGCPSTTIQGAIDAAESGATITIAAGNYYENIEVTKPVTLKGSGSATVVYPSVSQPTCPEGDGEGTLCEGHASIVIEVAASNVTIEKLSVNGSNPKLTSSHVSEGQQIDARGGIVENYEAGLFNDLTVAKVAISNIWERGLYASSEGSGFNFNHDTVSNVKGDENSIAIFNFGGSGQITKNTITNANDAIAANWSRGTKIESNKISKSAAAIHTDNNGGFGGTADTIKRNSVSGCSTNGYGIFTFATRVATALVEANKVTGCAVAFAAFGSEGVSGTDVEFVKNKASGLGASVSEGESLGMYISTSLLGFGAGPITVTAAGNKFERFGEGLFVEQAEGEQATVTAHENTFKEVPLGADGAAGTIVNAAQNWWGCSAGPNQGGKCSNVEGTVTFTPWLTSK